MKHFKLFSIPGLSITQTPQRRKLVRDNTLDIFNAEIWAREALLQLQGNMLLGNLVPRDFSNMVAKFGDIVNVARPGRFTARRKNALCEPVLIQDATADSLQVPLDQYIYSAFKICDGEENREMVDLVNTFLTPSVQGIALKVDSIVAGQQVLFWANGAGHLGGMNGTNIQSYLVETREVMNVNKVPKINRRMAITSGTESTMLNEELFVQVNTSGSTQTLRQGELGSLFGFDFFEVNDEPQVVAGQAAVTAAVNMAGGAPAGSTAITYDGAAGGAFTAGGWVVIAGDDMPRQIAAATLTVLTLATPLKRPVADNAVITMVLPGAVNFTNGYLGNVFNQNHRVVGYAGYILTNGWTTAPQITQPVSFGTSPTVYTIIDVSTTDDAGNALGAGNYGIQLDRPLDANVANAATVNLGPAGNYNFAFTDQSLATVWRPLPKPRTGAMSSVVTYDNLPLRVNIVYDGIQQAHIVTIDLLMGIAIYDIHTGAVMFG